MSDSTSLIDQLSTSQANIPARINETNDALSPALIYGRRASTSTGLTWGYYGGRWGGNAIANGTLALTASTTNYIVVSKSTGAVSVATATTNWNDSVNYARAYSVVAGTSTVTSWQDFRAGAGGTVGAGSSGGGGLTNWTEGVNTTGPNTTVPAVNLTAFNAASNVDIAITPKGTGALTAQTADNTTTGGNKRGANGAVDWQMSRTAAGQVASANFSSIVGGRSNTASASYAAALGGYSNTASGTSSAATGESNTASGYGSFASGYINAASGQYASVVGGNNNASSATNGFIGGGASNVANSGTACAVIGGLSNSVTGNYSCIGGSYFATDRGLDGAVAQATGKYSTTGDAQSSQFVYTRATSDATPTALSAGKATPSATTQIVLPNNSAYAFHALIVGRNNANGDCASFEVKGTIKRGASAAVTAIVGTVTATTLGADTGAAAWLATAVADTTLGALVIQVTGAASTSIKWVAKIRTVEMVG